LNAQVVGADATVRHSADEITRAKHEVARAEADHTALHAGAVRLRQAAAAKPGLIAQQELDDAEAKDRAAEAQVEAAKSALAAAEQQLGVSQANHQQVSALENYSHITAPFDGVVTWRYADTGALIQAGTSNANSLPVVKLAQVNVLRLRIPVPEEVAAHVHTGTPADIRVQATGEHFTGKVTRLTDSFDRSTRTEQVEVDVKNPDYRLSPGMYADVVLQLDRHADALTVPAQAVTRNHNDTTVLLVNPQNRVEVRNIQTGLEDPNRIEVLSGLREGDRVIIGSLGAYQAGERVTPKESKLADAAIGGGEQ
jgi:RND family efflux transporter MFP subunit